MASDWQNEDQFRAAQDRPAGGDRIKVGSDWQPTAAQQTAGQKYERPDKAACAALAPALRCPDCAAFVTDAEPTYPYVRRLHTASGKPHAASLPECPVPLPGLVSPPCRLSCGCNVRADWAGSFSAEMNRRVSGQAPGPLVLVSEASTRDRRDRWVKTLTALYSARDVASTADAREAVDYWIVVAADQAVRLGADKNALPSLPRPLSNVVVDWAVGQRLVVPLTALASAKGHVAVPQLSPEWGYGPDYPLPARAAKPAAGPARPMVDKLPDGRVRVAFADGHQATFRDYAEVIEFAEMANDIGMKERAAELLALLPQLFARLDDRPALEGGFFQATEVRRLAFLKAAVVAPVGRAVWPHDLVRRVCELMEENPSVMRVLASQVWMGSPQSVLEDLAAVRKDLCGYLQSGGVLDKRSQRFLQAVADTVTLEKTLPVSNAVKVPGPAAVPPAAVPERGPRRRLIRRVKY